MAGSKSLFQTWQRQKYLEKCSSSSAYYWSLFYRSPQTRRCIRHGVRLSIPAARIIPGVFRTTDSTHSFRAASRSLTCGTRIHGVCDSHTPEPVQLETFSCFWHIKLSISRRWRGFKCQRTCLAIFPCLPRKCIFFISRQNVTPTNNFSAISFVWVNKGFCLDQLMVNNDQVG